MEGEFFPGNQIFQLHKIHSIEILLDHGIHMKIE